MKRYALVIGIAEYESRNLPTLAKPVADAEAIAQLLEQSGNMQEVRRLPAHWLSADRSEVARAPLTAQELSAELKRLLLEQAVKGEALIYFSGHGFVVSDDLGGSEAYLAVSDTWIDVQNGKVVGQQNGISLRSLNNLLMQADLSSLVLLLDCCHAGSLLQKELVQHALASSATQRDYALIAACRGFENAYEGEEQAPHSIFTTALLQGLSQEQADNRGQVNSDRLAAAIDEQLKGKGQEPIRMNWGRPILLVTYPKAIAPTPSLEAFQPENPYRGLYAFEEDHVGLFYGRNQASWDILGCLLNNRFLAVIGASGSGKSSLVKAGVLPKLRQGQIPGSDRWQIRSMTPGRHPHGRLMEILEKLPSPNQPFFLFIDQFEEVFTLCEDETEKQHFMRLLVHQVDAPDFDLRIVIAIRADFLGNCADYDIADLINRSRPTGYVVKPLSRQELGEAIAQPAAQHGVTFESGLVRQIIADVLDRPGALPLLQYALKELWHICIEVPDSPQLQLTWAGYDKIGRVGGALEKRANLLYDSFSQEEQAFVRRLFVEEWVQLGEEQTVTRRRTTWERLDAIAPSPDLLRRVVDQLADQRLIVTDETTVEVAHESLLSEWKLLRDWIEQDREQIQLRQRLESCYRDWQERYNQSDNALMSGALLTSIEEKLNWQELPEVEYVRKSLERRDREFQAQLTQERQLREAAEAKAKAEEEKKLIEIEKALEAEARAKAETEKTQESSKRVRVEKQRNRWLSGAAIALSALAMLAFSLKQQAEQREQEAIEALVARPEQLLANQNQLEALIESVKVLKQLKRIGGNQASALARLQEVVYGVRERNRLKGHESGGIFAVSFSHDGQKIASAGGDRTVRLWDRQGKPLLQKPLLHQDRVWTVSFSSKDDLLASGDAAGRISLWNTRDVRKLSVKAHQQTENPILKVSFSPDDRLLAAVVYSDQMVEIWRIANSQLVRSRSIPQGTNPLSVSFSPNSQMIATGGEDGKVKLWRVSDGKLLKSFPHNDLVYDVAFHSQEMLVSGGKNKEVKFWRIADGKEVKRFVYGDAIYSIAFNPDRQLIVAAGQAGTIKIWRITDGQMIASLPNGNPVNSISFSSDNSTIVSSDENLIRLWHIFSNQPKDVKLTPMLEDACQYLNDYLSTSKTLIQQSDREICKDID